MSIESALIEDRLRSFRRFNQWEACHTPVLTPEEALEKSSDLAELYFALHGTPDESWAQKAAAWKRWRACLAHCPV